MLRLAMHAWICLLFLLASSGCQVIYNDDDFRNPSDMNGIDARVDGDGGPVDATPDAGILDANRTDASTLTDCEQRCPSGTCISSSPNDICQLNCQDPTVDCSGTMVCPPGLDCLISCQNNDCTMGIDCSQSGFCSMNCTGDNACGGPILCGTNGCTMQCTGLNACSGAIECGTGYCSISCTGSSACLGSINCQDACECNLQCDADACANVTCPRNCTSNDGCTNQEPGCQTCS